VIADIASHPLDRAHPLWEIWMVEGLATGELAFVAKIHHAVADGGAAAAMLAAVRSRAPGHADEVVHSSRAHAHTGETIPGTARLVGEALRDQVARLAGAAPLALRTALGGVAVLRRFREATTHPPIPFDTPRTPFNAPLSPTRSFATTALELARVKRVKEAFGVTLNDVVLALAGGALVRYLRGRGLPPDRSLIATVPVSIAEPGLEPRLSGNQLSNVFMSLCTDVAEPRERLRRIHDIAEAAKETHERLGPNVLVEWAEFAPPRIASWAIRTYSDLRLSRLHRPPANAIVSNVRGPGEALEIAGARLTHIYSVGPILDGIGVNLTAWSYGPELAFAVLAGRDAVPDAHLITAGLHDALEELAQAAGFGANVTRTATPARRRARAKRPH
jgi:diacylglycerol O-acyltransferase